MAGRELVPLGRSFAFPAREGMGYLLMATVTTGYSVVIPPLYSWVRQGFLESSGVLRYGRNGKSWHLADDRLYYQQPTIGLAFVTLCGQPIHVEPEDRGPSVGSRFVAITAEFPPGRTCSRCLSYRRIAQAGVPWTWERTDDR